MHRKSVCFVKSVRGAEPMEKAPVARPFWSWLCLAHMFFPCYPPILWISISLVLREVAPLAAVPATERSERVGEEAE